MDWLKLFTLLVAVASVSIKADGPKKKIRIHLPQKVKHIHHHKKIYITNHPATSQYAPAYMPSAEGTVAVPTNVLPMANIVPLNSVDIYDETQPRLPNISPAASQLLPLYHARGYYGPTPADLEETDYDSAPEPNEYPPQSYSSPAVVHSNHPPKRLKIIKLNEPPRKKVIRKIKPKRVIIRNKPQPPPPVEEHPVSTFHEQFYSDIDGSGTIRKIRKPPRVEKILDGDTEHIHTYSEEHIHKLSGIVGVDHFNAVPTITNPQGIIPFKNGQALLAIPSHSFGGLAAIGPLGHPSQLEYAAYNPREVTHDHIFHDHGEIPADLDINKDALGLPPKVSYNSNGLRITGSQKRPKPKNSQKSKKLSKPVSGDFSYYESIYSPNSRPNKIQRPLNVPSFDASGEASYDDYRSFSDFGYKDTQKKTRNPVASYYGKSNDYRVQQGSVPSPFSVSSTVVHDYKPNRYPGGSSAPAGLSKIRDPFANFKDTYANNFEYDTYASSSNIYTSEDKNDGGYTNQEKKSKKKSISTQNISFGDQDHITYVDHLEDDRFLDDGGPTALESDPFDESHVSDSVTSSPSAIKETSFFSMMAAKALNGEPMSLPQASNDNFQYADAPNLSTTEHAFVATTVVPSPSNNFQSADKTHNESHKFVDLKSGNKNKDLSHQQNYSNNVLESKDRIVLKDNSSGRDFRTRSLQNQKPGLSHDRSIPLVKGDLKYGDKI